MFHRAYALVGKFLHLRITVKDGSGIILIDYIPKQFLKGVSSPLGTGGRGIGGGRGR